MTMSATYSPDDNKLRLYSVSRLDADTYARVRKAGFIWAPKQGLFVAPAWTPDRSDLMVELCGEIGDEDTSLIDRAEERSDRFEEYRDKRRIDAERAEHAVSAIADHIPLGQPILVGHHSERHARKDAERIENGMRKAIKMWDTSRYWTARAAGAIRHAKYKELPRVRANRIKTLEADQRRQQREQDEARKFITLWGNLNKPSRGEELRPGVFAMDGPPADDAVRLKRATLIANYDHVSIKGTPERPYGSSLWSELDAGRMTPRAAQLAALACHARQIARTRRWIAHLENRIAYERAMLADQGASDLLQPKPRPAQLPLCNYRSPGGLSIENIYHRGEAIYYPQVEMTQAEYAKIHTDYKATRVVDHSHRVRTCMQGHSLVCVFLTDSKIHDRPAAQEAPPRTRPAPRTYTPAPVDPDQARIEALRATVAAGVQVVSAPQLFPTPADVARQVQDLADVHPGMRVLEPSAGTGNLIENLCTQGHNIIAVEINTALVDALRRRWNHITVKCADFLTCNSDLGTFDRIVMNPPFERGADIRHILHARHFLNPCGRLVAICANGPRQRETLQPIALEWIDLPAGTFETSGTNVNTAIVVLEAEEAD